jgi:hypothetical protein
MSVLYISKLILNARFVFNNIMAIQSRIKASIDHNLKKKIMTASEYEMHAEST